jgi:hypothetical protein
MRLLPPQTIPPTHRIERTHDPRVASGRYGYQLYRSCLRWDFGFTCAFCLLHEADLAEHGIEGTALTSVEHFLRFGTAPENASKYSNCFYACRFCNGARAAAPVIDRDERRLINPCDDAWGDHFFLSEDRLLARVGDRDAEYTEAAYNLNDPRKIALRQSRRERLTEWLELLEEGPSLEAELLQRMNRATPIERAQQNLRAAHRLRRCMEAALRDIRRYAAVPEDADASCRCAARPAFELPVWLRDQTLELESDPPSSELPDR